MDPYRSQHGRQPAFSAPYDSSSVSSTASPQIQSAPNIDYLLATMHSRHGNIVNPPQVVHQTAQSLYHATYQSGPGSPNETSLQSAEDVTLNGPASTHGMAPPQLLGGLPHNQKRAYRQRRKDPSCDACRERKVKCDATDTSSCSECSSRNVRCQFTKETNRRMSSIKQVQDLERQLTQARQQIERLKSVIPRSELPIDLDTGSPFQTVTELPSVGLPPPRRTKHPAEQDLSRARINIRNYARGLLKAPAPYREIGSLLEQPHDVPPLPSKHSADRLLGQYYECIHRRFPILHWPTFCEEYQEVYRQGTVAGMPRIWAAILFLVFACGSMHTLDPHRVKEGQTYLEKGTTLIDIWQDELSMDQAKMALLTSIFLTELNLKSVSWVWLGSAVRIAEDLGLHLESGPWPTIEGEMRKRTWYSIYAWDRLLALELGKPMLIDDANCETEYPRPVDDQYITSEGILQGGESTPLLATIHVVRSLQSLTKLFKSSWITPETLQSTEKYLSTCMTLFPKQLLLSSAGPLDPRSVAPLIYLQNARLMLHRHNLSPYCPPDLRTQAINHCVHVGLDTARLLSRCMGHRLSPDLRDWRALLATSASTLLCTHVWRCTLFLLFRGEYAPASTLVEAASVIGNAKLVNISCGRNISFFLRNLLERLQQGQTRDLEKDEEMMVYVSGDMQSSPDNSWVWQGSEPGANLSKLVENRHVPLVLDDTGQSMSPPFEPTLHDSVLNAAEKHDWGGWDYIERTLQALLDQQQQHQLPRLHPGPAHMALQDVGSAALQGGTILRGQPLAHSGRQTTQADLGSSRMIIANII